MADRSAVIAQKVCTRDGLMSNPHKTPITDIVSNGAIQTIGPAHEGVKNRIRRPIQTPIRKSAREEVVQAVDPFGIRRFDRSGCRFFSKSDRGSWYDGRSRQSRHDTRSPDATHLTTVPVRLSAFRTAIFHDVFHSGHLP